MQGDPKSLMMALIERPYKLLGLYISSQY